MPNKKFAAIIENLLFNIFLENIKNIGIDIKEDISGINLNVASFILMTEVKNLVNIMNKGGADCWCSSVPK